VTNNIIVTCFSVFPVMLGHLYVVFSFLRLRCRLYAMVDVVCGRNTLCRPTWPADVFYSRYGLPLM